MRAIAPPNMIYLDVLNECINGIVKDVDLKTRLQGIRDDLEQESRKYSKRAPTFLYGFKAFTGNKDALVLRDVTKGELTKQLYDYLFVNNKKNARRLFYDKLMLLAPFDACPHCGFGTVKTLDHYLPKAQFPKLSVAPENLVPACRDCNTDKGNPDAFLRTNLPIHPYFDRGSLINEQWLFADVRQTTPVTFVFRCTPPTEWDDVDSLRVEAHFIDFKLERRFATQAAIATEGIRKVMTATHNDGGEVAVRNDLLGREDSFRDIHPNSWEVATYQALAASDWYCSGGFGEV